MPKPWPFSLIICLLREVVFFCVVLFFRWRNEYKGDLLEGGVVGWGGDWRKGAVRCFGSGILFLPSTYSQMHMHNVRMEMEMEEEASRLARARASESRAALCDTLKWLPLCLEDERKEKQTFQRRRPKGRRRRRRRRRRWRRRRKKQHTLQPTHQKFLHFFVSSSISLCSFDICMLVDNTHEREREREDENS